MFFFTTDSLAKELISNIAASVKFDLDSAIFGMEEGRVLMIDTAGTPVFGVDILGRSVICSDVIPLEIQDIVLRTLESHFSKMEKLLEIAISNVEQNLPYYSVA